MYILCTKTGDLSERISPSSHQNMLKFSKSSDFVAISDIWSSVPQWNMIIFSGSIVFFEKSEEKIFMWLVHLMSGLLVRESFGFWGFYRSEDRGGIICTISDRDRVTSIPLLL